MHVLLVPFHFFTSCFGSGFFIRFGLVASLLSDLLLSCGIPCVYLMICASISGSIIWIESSLGWLTVSSSIISIESSHFSVLLDLFCS